jgi:hypothetical protein
MAIVTIWHNIATDLKGRYIAVLDGYQPGHPLVPVARYPLTVPPAGRSPLDVAEDAYRLFNIGDNPTYGPPDPRAITYRQRRNRSLSVGDAVQIDDLWLTCASAGFTPIPAPSWIARHATTFGTTPLERTVEL